MGLDDRCGISVAIFARIYNNQTNTLLSRGTVQLVKQYSSAFAWAGSKYLDPAKTLFVA